MKTLVLGAFGLFAAGAIALLPADAIHALLDDEVQLAGDCKVVFVDGQADHCVVVIPGTDTPVNMPSRP